MDCSLAPGYGKYTLAQALSMNCIVFACIVFSIHLDDLLPQLGPKPNAQVRTHLYMAAVLAPVLMLIAGMEKAAPVAC